MAELPARYKTTPMLEHYRGEHLPGGIFGTPVRYLSARQRDACRLQFRDGVIYDADGNVFDTSDGTTLHSDDGRAIFIMDEHGNFYASKAQRIGRFHHSSFMAGGTVAAAGEIKVENGRLTLISNKSGHYQPESLYTRQALHALAKHGVRMDDVRQDFMRP